MGLLHGAIALRIAMAGFAVESVHEQAPAEVTVRTLARGFNFAEFCVAGERFFPIGPQPEFFAFMGCDSGFWNLLVARRTLPI